MATLFDAMRGTDCFSQSRLLYSVLENAQIKKDFFSEQLIVFQSWHEQGCSASFFCKTFSRLLNIDCWPLDAFMQSVVKIAHSCNLHELTLEERLVWRNIAHKIKQIYSKFNAKSFVSKVIGFSQRIEPSSEMQSLISGEMISFPVTLVDLPPEIKKQIFSYFVDEKMKKIKALRPLLFSIDFEHSFEIIKNHECYKELSRYVLLPKKPIQKYSEAKKFLDGIVAFINDVQHEIPLFKENGSPSAIMTDIDKLQVFFRKLYMYQLTRCFGDKVEYPLKYSFFEVYDKVKIWLDSQEAQTLTELDFSHKDLFCVPIEIGMFKCLRSLNLRNNNLRTLPWELVELNKLKRLDIEDNSWSGDVVDDVLRVLKLHCRSNELIIDCEIFLRVNHCDFGLPYCLY